MSWKLAPCLQVLFNELDAVAPGRDHTTDGTIGDAAHQGTDSDHNPDANGIVCAGDFDKDLRADFTMWDVTDYLIGECRKPNDVGLDRGRLNYWIWDGWIWRADTGWAKEKYTGSSPHTDHAHGSCEHALSYVNDSRPWGLLERFGDDMDQETFNARMDAYCKRWETDKTTGWEGNPLARLITDHQSAPNPFNGVNQKGPLYDVLRDTAQCALDSQTAIGELRTAVTAQAAQLEQILAALNSM